MLGTAAALLAAAAVWTPATPGCVVAPAPGAAAAAATTVRTVASPHLTGTLPIAPRRRPRPVCAPVTRPVAVTLDGVPLLPAVDARGRRIDDGLRPDGCGRRTDAADRASFRVDALPCLDRPTATARHGAHLGWARDGYPVFGRHGATRLDRCGGHTHRVTVAGRARVRYHYHRLDRAPFLVACFRATPSRDWTVPPAAEVPAGETVPGPAEVAPAPLPDIDPPATPALIPSFDPAISDYVARCAAAQDEGRATTFTVRRSGVSTTHRFRCLPADFPSWTVERPGTPQARWYLVTPTIFGPGGHYAVIFDDHGVPVWWLRSDLPPLDARVLPDGTVAFARYGLKPYGVSDDGAYEIRRLDGTLVREVRTVGSPTDHHELEPLTNGNVALLTYRRRDGVDLSALGLPADASVMDTEIQELAPDGALAWSWNSADHISLAESARWASIGVSGPHPGGGTVYDLTHGNAIDETVDGFLLSLRHTDAVYRIDRATGDITWKLGGTAIPQSLTVHDDPLAATGLFGGQHDVRVLPDGTVSVFDNGSARGRPPRAARYAVDPEAGLATLLEDVRAAFAPGSVCCGSARRLPGGNWVFSFGGTSDVAELDPTGATVLRLRFADLLSSYRAVPYAPDALSPEALRAGMDARVAAP